MSKSYIPKALKSLVYKRAKGYCEYCLLPNNFSPTAFEIDHIYPESLDGETIAKNLALACGECNNKKHNKTHYSSPTTKEQVRLYNPRIDSWDNHFEWNEDFMIIKSKTLIGRATIVLLNVNRERNQNLRSLLFLVGLHPPSDYP